MIKDILAFLGGLFLILVENGNTQPFCEKEVEVRSGGGDCGFLTNPASRRRIWPREMTPISRFKAVSLS